jgi:hypothetical protein
LRPIDFALNAEYIYPQSSKKENTMALIIRLATTAAFTVLALPMFGALPIIESAIIDTYTNQITITGRDFAPSGKAPAVTLNNKALVLVSFTNPKVDRGDAVPAGGFIPSEPYQQRRANRHVHGGRAASKRGAILLRLCPA